MADLQPLSSYSEKSEGDGYLIAAAHQRYLASEYKDAIPLYNALMAHHSQDVSAEAFFWASCCYEQIGDIARASELREKLMAAHPSSEWSAEAYLKSFPISHYACGEPAAMARLAALPTLFPESPLQLFAYLMMGLEAQREANRPGHWQQALGFFTRAEACWWKLQARNRLTTETETLYRPLYLMAMLGRAQSLLQNARRESPLQRVITLKAATAALEQLIATEIDLSALYQLAIAYRLDNDHSASQKALESIISRCNDRSIGRHSALAKAHLALGQYLISSSLEKALAHFEAAENAGVEDGIEELQLWMHKAHCLRSLQRSKEALPLLSKVINSTIISSLRMEAMLLRAELYAEQGKAALAVKQLERAIKSGGKWRESALEQLAKLKERRGVSS